MAKYSPVPVLNALSSFWHPTQILADLLTLHEHAHLFVAPDTSSNTEVTQDASEKSKIRRSIQPLPELRPLKIAYVGDSTNVLHDMLVTYPRFGHSVQVSHDPNAIASKENG